MNIEQIGQELINVGACWAFAGEKTVVPMGWSYNVPCYYIHSEGRGDHDYYDLLRFKSLRALKRWIDARREVDRLNGLGCRLEVYFDGVEWSFRERER